MEPHPSLAPFARSLILPRGTAFYYDTGRPRPGAPTLLLIHGLGDEADSWSRLVPLLAPDFRILAPDLPGFGRSLRRGPTRLGDCAELALRVLAGAREAAGAAGGGEALIIVGSSLGAAVAELLAFRQPGLAAGHATGVADGMADGLVLMDGGFPAAGGAPPALLRMLTPVIGERAYRSLRGRPEAAYESLRPYYADLEALPAEQRDFLRRRVVERVESGAQMRAYFSLLRSAFLWAAFRGPFFSRGLAAFEAPVLGVFGERDAIADRGALALQASLAPRFASAVVPGCGHLPQQEAPEALAELLRGFAAGLAGGIGRP